MTYTFLENEYNQKRFQVGRHVAPVVEVGFQKNGLRGKLAINWGDPKKEVSTQLY